MNQSDLMPVNRLAMTVSILVILALTVVSPLVADTLYLSSDGEAELDQLHDGFDRSFGDGYTIGGEYQFTPASGAYLSYAASQIKLSDSDYAQRLYQEPNLGALKYQRNSYRVGLGYRADLGEQLGVYANWSYVGGNTRWRWENMIGYPLVENEWRIDDHFHNYALTVGGDWQLGKALELATSYSRYNYKEGVDPTRLNVSVGYYFSGHAADEGFSLSAGFSRGEWFNSQSLSLGYHY
ncbi:MAG: outer membrane beta-barrel protein [Gammaproteobacteria bacterium]|nr:outer membrane beta-barrel protein [Gammaproteobacteria bacterium]